MKTKDVKEYNKTAGLEVELRGLVTADGKFREGVSDGQKKRVVEIKKILKG
jgi:hypothetical protein